MNQIQNALTQGYSHQNIMQFLLRQFPHARKKIESALAKGFTAEKIVQFLGGGRKEVSEPITEHEKTRSSDREKQRNLEKNAIKAGVAIGGTALGAYALSRALPQATRALQGQLLPALPGGQLPQGPPPTIGVTPQRLGLPPPGQAAMQPPPPQPQGPPAHFNPSAQNRPLPQASVMPSPPQQPMQPMQAPQAVQNIPTPPIEKPIAPLPKKLEDMANGMLQANKKQSPDEIANALKKLSPRETKEYEKTTGQPIIRAVEELSKSIPQQPQKTAATAVPASLMEKGMEPQGQQIVTAPEVQVIEEPIKETPKKEKGSLVALPSGEIGEISDIRQGIAKVDIDGKQHSRKIEDLIESPLPQKELHELHDDLVKGIELETGEELSRMANIVGYDENKRALAFHPVGSQKPLYVYTGLDDDEVKELMETEQMRRTSGGNFIGAYKEGTKSVQGSKLFDFIRKLQSKRGGKGSEYEFKFNTIYDAFGPAKKSSEEEFKKKKEAERALKPPKKKKGKK